MALRPTAQSVKPSGRLVHESIDRSVRFVIDLKQHLVIAKFGRRLTNSDLENYARSLCANPSFDPSFSEIADISDVAEVALEGNDFLKLADRVDPYSFDSKRAFVARTPVQKHAARMHKILRSQRNFEIFESLEEAERWIAL